MKLNLSLQLIIFSFLFPQITSAQYNLSFASNFTYPAGYEMSGCWGYTDSSGREYAIIGTTNGTSILNVTIPEAPEELFFIEGGISIWREAKVWNNHAYISTEAINEGMLIIDLNNLPFSIDTITFKGDTVHPFTRAHTIFIDENGICYLFGYNALFGTNEGAYIVDLNPDPKNPEYLGEFTNFYIHDGYVRNDTLWAAEIYEGRFEALDVSDKDDIILLGTQNTGGAATHNCWLSDDGNYLFTTDEINFGFIESFDVSDITDIKKIDAIKHGPSNITVAHNTYYYNGYLVTAHYSEGVTIHDAHKPDNLIEVGHFDTTPLATDAYEGVWGVYPYFNSQNIIATDRQLGVFILQPSYERACYLEGTVINTTTLSNIFDAKIKILGTEVIDSSNLIGEYKTGYYQNGIYDIEISATGCATQIYNDIVLTNGDVTVLNGALDCALSIEGNPFENGDLNIIYNATISVIQINFELLNLTSTKLNLLNVTGEIISSIEISGTGSATFNTNNIPAGTYFISVEGEHFSPNKKIMIY